MSEHAYILTEQALTVYYNADCHTINAEDPRFEQAIELLRAEDYESLIDLMKPVRKLNEVFAMWDSMVRIVDDTVFYGDTPLHTYVASKAIELHSLGLNPQSLLNFIGRVMKNPSYRARNETFKFLEVGNLPITSDGCFLAYKRVRDDYRDVHSGRIDNSVGQIVTMDRYAVDDDSNRTCSAGLHFASRDYLQHFPGNHLMVLKIDPADVVSIPVDYNNTKGRCCRYEVVGELPLEDYEKHDFGGPVCDDYDDDYSDEDWDEANEDWAEDEAA